MLKNRLSARFFFIGVALLMLVGIFMGASRPAVAAPMDAQSSVRIWVEYASGQKNAAHRDLEALGATFHYTFTDLHSYVVTIPQAAIASIEKNPHFAGWEEDVPRYLYGDGGTANVAELTRLAAGTQDVPWGIDRVQARDVWDANRDGAIDAGAPTGAGRTVCIIDTGFYRDHEDFQGINVSGYSQQSTEWYIDGYGHGSHVAGTIAGVNNSVGVVGVTPGTVRLFIVKFFNDAGSATLSSDLVAAANTCASNGANVISMSLGGGRASGKERNAFDNLYAQGVLSVAAAGNDGTTGLSYPASYDSVVSVAAIDSSNTVASFSQQNSQVELAAPGVSVESTVPYVDNATVTVNGTDYSGGLIEFAAQGSASGVLVDGGLCDSVGAWSGKVVLCQRGTISFYDKVMNVQNGGGTAAIIYNNVSGDFGGTLGSGNSSAIPALSLSQENGQLLLPQVGSNASVVAQHTWPASGYAIYDGTSMATPHVSGVAALVWSANPTWTNVQIRQALQQSALDLGAAGRDNAYGYGLVQAYAAWQLLGGGGGSSPTPTPVPGPTATPSSTGALSVSVATDKATYTRNQTASITVTVTDGSGAPVSGASVALTINAPKSTLSGSSTTNSSGVAVFTYSVNTGRDGVGTYTVSATASKTGYTSGSGSTTFTVQ